MKTYWFTSMNDEDQKVLYLQYLLQTYSKIRIKMQSQNPTGPLMFELLSIIHKLDIEIFLDLYSKTVIIIFAVEISKQ